MLHFSCDGCGKDLLPGGATRFVVKVEAFAAGDPAELTAADVADDHVEEMARMLEEQEGGEGGTDVVPAAKTIQLDLCRGCYRKFLADPLGRDHAAKLQFSKN